MATSSSYPQPLVDRLGPSDLIEVFGFLDRDPVLNVYLVALVLRDALGRTHDTWLGARRDGSLTAVAFVGGRSGAVLPAGDDPEGLERLGDEARQRVPTLPRRFQVIGAQAAVDPFMVRFADGLPAPRLDRAQLYMALDQPALDDVEPAPALRPATPADRLIVYDTGAALRAEELEEDPRVVDPEGYARRVEEECRDGHTLVWTDARGLCFRAGISARTADAAQISGVYVPPARRGRGYATRGVAEMCRRYRDHSRTACLFVNDFNAPALAVYRRLGFVIRAPWRSVFYGG